MLSSLPRLIGVGVLWLASTVAAIWAYDAVRPAPEPPAPVEVQMVQRVMTQGDLAEPSTPATRTEYEAPDSSDTIQDCVTVPSWVLELTDSPRPSRTTTATETEQRTSVGTADSLPSTQRPSVGTSSHVSDGRPYVITPMTSGRPALSVTTHTVTLSAVDPRDGSGLEYRYDVPRPDWRFTAEGRLYGTLSLAAATASAQLQRRTSAGWIGLGPAAVAVATGDRFQAGYGVALTFQSTLWNR